MNKDLEKIRKKLGHLTLDWKPSEFLDTGVPDLNEVLGHREKGLQYGRIIELAGWESQGKSMIALTIASLAQAQGALVIWADYENSFDETWAIQRGLNVEETVVIQPYIGKFGKEANERLATAQELCEEVESIIKTNRKKYDKMLLVGDSIAAMLTEGESDGGISGQTMRTNMELPMFLSKLFRRWIGLAQTHNVLMFFTNQLRSKPDQYNPDYTPGGRAVAFYCHVRARIRRAKGGYIKDHGKNIGIQGIIKNRKNKTGSPENGEVGFKYKYAGSLEFLKASKLEREE
jgi:RecA/RadA recombinase